MRDLLADYRTETISELTKIYVKSCILKEFLYVFPFLTRISFTDPQFFKYISKKLKNIYYTPISIFIESEEVFFTLCSEALLEIQEALALSNALDLVEQFPNIAFKSYESEKNIENTYDSNIYEEKYVKGNIYREYYIRVEDAQVSEARDDLENGFLNRTNEYRGVINPTSFKEFVQFSVGLLTQDRFLSLVTNRFLGVRLVYNSPLHISNVQNHRVLYDSILEESRYIYEKTNALSFRKNQHTIYFKFPLVLAKKEIMFPPALGSMQAMIDYINSTAYFDNMAELSNRLWEDPNFSKLFNYHIPVKMFQAILFNNLAEKYYLLQEVMQENKVFQDLDTTIINLLNRIKFAEDPTNI